MRCKATTKNGHRCRNAVYDETSFCFFHKDNIDLSDFGYSLLGAAVGNAIIPGLGGALLGATASSLANQHYRRTRIVKKKVFVSFDFDNDRKLKDFIIGQSRLPDSPFDIVDHSLKEAAPEHNWEAKANAAIRRSDTVIVMVGPKTHRAQGVLKEIQMARNANKHIVQVIGYKNGDYTPVPAAGRLYRWNWENLKKILS